METIKKFEPLFGDWHVDSLLGAGSFGKVYKIYRDELGRRYYSALKYISIPIDTSEVNQLRMDGLNEESISTYYTELTKNITEETKLMSRLRGHTNIVSFEDSKVIPKPGGIGYDIFIKMELLTSLPNRMLKAPLTKQDVVKLGIDICSALVRCGKIGVIHRDIKPDNIFVSDAGDYKLGDFGVARQLEKTAGYMSKKGTYNYMAPEVYKGEPYGAGCDIYSLGLVMYRLLNNGRLPFLPPAPQMITPNDRDSALVRRMAGEPLPPPSEADPALSAIVLKACAPDPAKRYATAAELCADLTRYSLGGDPSSVGAAVLTGLTGDLPDERTTSSGSGEKAGKAAEAPEKATAGTPAKAKKSKKGLIIGIIAAVAALAAAFAVLKLTGVLGGENEGQPTPMPAAADTGTAAPTPEQTAAPTEEPPQTVSGKYRLTKIDGVDVAEYFIRDLAESLGMTVDEMLESDEYGEMADAFREMAYCEFSDDGTGVLRFSDYDTNEKYATDFTWVQSGNIVTVMPSDFYSSSAIVFSVVDDTFTIDLGDNSTGFRQMTFGR